MLKQEGSYILPENVPANEFLNLENDKISTSRNWAVWLHEYLEEFPGKQDVLRYVLCANAPENKDNDFTWKDFQARNNNELLAIFGNFVNRTLVLTQKYFDGVVPEITSLKEIDNILIEELKTYPEKIANSLENYRFREALGELMNMARLGNKYLTETEPWKIFKIDVERVQTVLNLSLQICANLALYAEAFLPFTSTKLYEMLNISRVLWNDGGGIHLLKAGHILNKPDFLFERIEDAEIEAQLNKLLATKEENAENNIQVNPQKENIVFDDFVKMDIRTATIIEAEKVPKTKKLLKLKLATGLDERIVVSGIAEFYKPEDIIGQKVSVLVNLAPRTLKGIESKGMILMAENAKGELCFVQASEEFNNGSEIK